MKTSRRASAHTRPLRGITHIYTGNGKGKTTAALGLILRACGRDCRVYLGQFLKKGLFGEVRALKARIPEVVVEQYGHGPFVRGKPCPVAVRMARRGLDHVRRAVMGGEYDLVVADELITAVDACLVSEDEVLDILLAVPAKVEFVMTGRGATARLVRAAGLVTEMREVKHYFRRGVRARRGIEM
jgi:cob(I)alamin adenosyltransferase